MNLLVFWNELAELPLAENRIAARKRMDLVVDVLAALHRVLPGSPPPRLRTHAPLHAVYLAEEYTVANWLVETDQARRLMFLKLDASSPLLRVPEDPGEALNRYGCTDCFHDGVRAAGLRAAWASGELALSLDSHPCWRQSQVSVDVEMLDASDTLVRHIDNVRHVSAVPHVEAHQPWLKARQLRTVSDGYDLWDRRSELFPRLDFCREVRKQLGALDAGSDELQNVMRRLIELEASFACWDGSPLHQDFIPSKCTPETPQTLREEADDHTATRADGSSHLFKWHARFTPGAGRIFFDGDSSTRRGLIGYVGFKKGNKLT